MSSIVTAAVVAAATIIGALLAIVAVLWRRSRADAAQAAKDRAEAAHIRALHQQQVERDRRNRKRAEVEALRAAERRAAEVREVYRAGEVATRIESPDAEVSDAAATQASADALRALAGWDDARR
jgi:Flp pilus assembly protein TadB